jgi:hypothetical protein
VEDWSTGSAQNVDSSCRGSPGLPNLAQVLYNSIGSIQMDSTYQFHLNGSYPLPIKIKLSGNYQYLTGQPFNPTYTVITRVDPGLTQVTQNVFLYKPGSQRLPNLNLMDLRVSRPFRIHERWLFEPILDLYNVLNVNTSFRSNCRGREPRPLQCEYGRAFSQNRFTGSLLIC